MINNQQIDEILKKSQEVEKQIEDNKKRQLEINNKLIELNTKKQQIIDELNKLGISEDKLENSIETLYKEVQDELTRFEQSQTENK